MRAYLALQVWYYRPLNGNQTRGVKYKLLHCAAHSVHNPSALNWEPGHSEVWQRDTDEGPLRRGQEGSSCDLRCCCGSHEEAVSSVFHFSMKQHNRITNYSPAKLHFTVLRNEFNVAETLKPLRMNIISKRAHYIYL